MPVMSLRNVRIGRKRALEVTACRRRVPVMMQRDVSERHLSLRKARSDFQRPLGGRSRLGHRFHRRKKPPLPGTELTVDVRDARMSEREIRIPCKSLLEALQRLPEDVARPLGPEIAASEVEGVGLAVGSLQVPGLVDARLERLGEPRSDVLLDIEHAFEPPFVILRPFLEPVT